MMESIVTAVVGIGFAVFLMLYMKKNPVMMRMATVEAQNTGSRAEELAQRMGLQVIEGDPMTNLQYARSLAITKGGVTDIRLRLEGAPGGRATQLLYYDHIAVDSEEGKTSTAWLTAELSVQVSGAFPEFEVLQLNPGLYASEVKPKVNAPHVAFADPPLRDALFVRCADPRIAPVIAEALWPMIGWGWVHIHGQGDKLTFVCTELSISYLGIGDQIQHVLHEMARSLERASAAEGAA